jgi:DUF971 family protein
MNYRPTDISASKSKRELIITWSDSHVSNYSFPLLRAACPCAPCRGGHENMKAEPDPSVFTTDLPDSPETHLVNVRAVGSYAIAIVWEDGHDYGIYNWHYLRALCPCGQHHGKA